MAINIKNERTVALARELAERNGTSITAAITNALEASLAQSMKRVETPEERHARFERVRRYVEELNEGEPPFDSQAALAALYDENGLPI